MTIREMAQAAYENAKAKGFWAGQRSTDPIFWISTKLCLIHSEVSEALEELRRPAPNLGEELADVVIRVGDLARGLGIDLEAEVLRKMAANKDRPVRHGKRF